MELTKFYSYVLSCSDGSLYSGYTNNLEKRTKTHNSKKGAKYTRARTPVKLVYFEEYSSKSLAMKSESAFKKLRRSDKILYISEHLTLEKKNTIEEINSKL